MIITCAAEIQNEIQLVANIFTIAASLGVVLALITYLYSRLTSEGYYGINQIEFSPPLVSRSLAGYPNTIRELIKSSTNGQITRYPIEAPIIVILPITLVNTDVFSETLTGASLTIEKKTNTGTFDEAQLMVDDVEVKIGTKNKFKLPALQLSQNEHTTRSEDGEIVLSDATWFSERILNRGTEKHFNFFFFPKPPSGESIDDALLGWLTPGTYTLT